MAIGGMESKFAIQNPSRTLLVSAEIGIVLAVFFAPFWLTVQICEVFFVYTLDDPYIHLALARSITHGTYGINDGASAAPSSSIMWPFVLVPFGYLPDKIFELIPLVINTCCLVASVCLLVRLMPRHLNSTIVLLGSLGLVLGLNLIGLVLNGMEHSLQVLVVLIMMNGLFELHPDEKGEEPSTVWRWAFYLGLAVLPLIRYEGLALSVPLLAWRFVAGDRNAALAAAAFITITLGAFSAFLWSNGLGILPSSVLAKSEPNGGFHFLGAFLGQVESFWPLFASACVLSAILYLRGARALGAVVFVATLLQFAYGRFGWFGRYEIYWLTFVMILLVRETARVLPLFTPLVPLLAIGLDQAWTATLYSPLGSQNIYSQQVQSARIARFLDGPVAINDLGPRCPARQKRCARPLWSWLTGGPALAAKQSR